MHILQVGDNDTYSAKFAGQNLSKYLNEANVPSDSMVFWKYKDEPNTIELSKGDVRKRALYEDSIRLDKECDVHCFSSPFSLELLRSRHFLDADIIHYHLIHNYFFNFHYLPLLTKIKASVLSLHDPWIITGHCVYPGACERWRIGCGDCPDLHRTFAMARDSTALNWVLKRDVISRSNVQLVVASVWMKTLVTEAEIVEPSRIHHVPYGVDLRIFKPGRKNELRDKYHIDRDAMVVGFRSDDNENKGLSYIKHALSSLDKDIKIEIVTLAKKGLVEELRGRYKISEFGWIKDDNELADIYSLMDLFLMPSEAEAFGMMAIESMACGVPVLSIEGTALEDVIGAPSIGVITKRSTEAYSDEFARLVASPAELKERGRSGMLFVEERYNLPKYINSLKEIYKALAEKPIPNKIIILEDQVRKHLIDSEPRVIENPSSSTLVARATRKVKATIKRIIPQIIRDFIKKF